MKETATKAGTPEESLKHLGLDNLGHVYWDLPTSALYEEAIRRYEAALSHLGPLVMRTGQYTGRLPKDKFLVRETSSENKICWGKINRPLDPEKFDALKYRLCAYLQGKDIFIQNCYAGADEHYRVPIRIITERATAALFARTMFIRELDLEKLAQHVPEFTVLHAPSFHADPAIDGTHSEAFVLMHFGKKLILIGGTAYAGEIKKSIFTVMNYLLPQKGVMAMHCSANYGSDKNDVAIFFGLSGTGKTTLSADPGRTLIGDDEHGWSDDGVFNVEGGCYAKVIRLSREGEPEIYDTTRRFGTVLENVVCDEESRELDLDADTLTENTRSSYPLTQLASADLGGCAGHPKHVVFLTCDALGVLPPISRLTPDQAMYHFLSGYTARVAGTERGVVEPKVTFSTCFASPFLPLHPGVYAKMLGERLQQHRAKVWMINTGWTGGPYGTGKRIKLGFTRRMVHAALAGELDGAATWTDPIFGLAVPERVEGVPDAVLRPRESWKSTADYDAKAAQLADMFAANFEKYESGVDEAVRSAGPRRVPAG